MDIKSEKYFILQEELKDYHKALGQAVDIIMDNDVTKYPILVIHKQEVEIGIPIMDKDKISGNWSVNASSLEEFIAKQIIKEEKLEEFKSEFKNPVEYLCIFSLSEIGAKFIYIQRTDI